ncbi:MAG: FixH family protein [Pyrinomonadaceae bacterium]|nr:FixH family protein [Pyrinomonadaceae bacterium]
MQKLTIAISFVALLLLIAACGSNAGTDTGKVIKSQPVGNNLTVTLSNEDGQIKHGEEDFYLVFKDASGKPVDVGSVALNFYMPAMGPMQAMNDPTTFTTTETPGVYKGKANIEMAGEWQAQVSYEGPAGKGKTSFPVMAQ